MITNIMSPMDALRMNQMDYFGKTLHLQSRGYLEGVMNLGSGTIAAWYGYSKTLPDRRFRRGVGVHRSVSGACPRGRAPI